MSITRDELYDEVWAEPMTKVAARHGVSANYLARVCEHLNVPYPHRGYWAKKQVGKAPARPRLPAPRPGEVPAWARGDSVPKPAKDRGKPAASATTGGAPTPVERAVRRHQLVTGVRESFEKARFSDVGYLRPFKRNLVDVFVTKETLGYALDTANDLFLRFEARGHRVVLSPDAYLHRPELPVFEGQKFSYYNSEPWRPGRATIVHLGSVAFGLTLYELTEHVEVTYRWDNPIRYVRVDQVPAKRIRAWERDSPAKNHMPCGRLGLRAYSPYSGVPWEKRWTETKPGTLVRSFPAVIKELEGEAPALATRCEEARRQAEVERQRREVARRERERREREERRAAAVKASRDQLLVIINDWALACRVESFFTDADGSVSRLPPQDAVAVRARLDRARQLFGGVDTLRHFEAWLSPRDRLAGEAAGDEVCS